MRWWQLKKRHADLERELQSDLELEEEEQRENGLSPEEARQAALRALGNTVLIKEQAHEAWGWAQCERLWQDVRYAVRQLLRSPGFSLTALLTLTMAIGANVIVFGVANDLLFNPLPVPQPKQVYSLQGKHTMGIAFSWPDYQDIRDRAQAFSGIALMRLTMAGLSTGQKAVPVWGYEVSSNYFQTLGVQPALGRFFTPSKEVKINGVPDAVLSYDCWQTQFNGDRDIIGKTVRINKIPFTVIGVAPRGFYGTERLIWSKIWLPIEDEPEIEGYNWIQYRGNQNGWLVGRLKPGVTAAQADADLANVAASMARQYPDSDKNLSIGVAQPGLFGNMIGAPVRAFVTGIMLMAFLVLLAACANLAGFFTARMTDRAREMGIRIAIGASRLRLMRQLLTESILIAVAGGIAASLLALLTLRVLSAWRPSIDFPFELVLNPGAKVYLFASALALVTGLIFGLLPARQIWRTDPNRTLKSGMANPGSRRFPVRDILLTVQIALCCLLVTSSFVALRGMMRTLNLHLGVDPQNTTLASLDLALAGYPSKSAAAAQQRMLDAVRQIPGIESASLSNSVPLSINQSTTSIFAPGTTAFNASAVKFRANYYEIVPGYFHTAGTRLLRGRDFTVDDNDKSPSVAIINETLAKQLFGTADAVGKRFPTDTNQFTRIVGVVEDGKYATFTEDPTAALFWPLAQSPDTTTVLLVRSPRPPAEMIPAVRRAISDVDPAVPILSVDTWPHAMSFFLLPQRAATVALGVLGAFAMMLALTGIFGLASYTVSRRMREFGVRIALGARHWNVLRSALGRIFVLLTAGAVAGLALGFAGSRIIAGIVYKASAFDPLVIVAVALTMVGIGLLAAFGPARRALAAEPARLLRED